MIVGASGQIQSLTSSNSGEIRPKPAEESGNLVPPADGSTTVSISEVGKTKLQKEIDGIAKTREAEAFIDLKGREERIRFGLILLGENAVAEWSAKGLELSEEALLSAVDAFQQGFRDNVERNGASMAGSSVALNRHQIVMNAQEVPDWFVQEYEIALSAIDNSETRSAFERGDLFFSSPPSTSQSVAMNSYAKVAANI